LGHRYCTDLAWLDLAIDDAGYSVEFYINGKSDRHKEKIVFENSGFPLYIEKKLVLADLAVLKEWVWDLDWTYVNVQPGYYQATIRGFCEKNRQGHITDCGYEVILESTASLPKFTASLDMNYKVLIIPNPIQDRALE
jgi:hypothetical protein